MLALGSFGALATLLRKRKKETKTERAESGYKLTQPRTGAVETVVVATVVSRVRERSVCSSTGVHETRCVSLPLSLLLLSCRDGPEINVATLAVAGAVLRIGKTGGAGHFTWGRAR